MIYLFIYFLEKANRSRDLHVWCTKASLYKTRTVSLCTSLWNTTVRVWVGTATRRDFPLSRSLFFHFYALFVLCFNFKISSQWFVLLSLSLYQFFLFGWILIDVSIWTRFTFVLGTREIARIVIFRLQVELSPFFHYFSALSFTCWNYFSACACVVRKPWTCIICNIF